MLPVISYIISGLIIFACIYLGVSTNILKNSTTTPKSSYSFSRVQLMWWTIIISSAFIILFAKTGEYDFFNQSSLLLLGIGVITSAGGSIIDKAQQIANNATQQNATTKGFMTDILSDENGVAMHRLQAVIFNLLFGITFIITFWTKSQFPEFNTSELALLGLSSGAYLALKTNENKVPKTATT